MANRIEQMTNVQKEALELFTRKNTDYGDSFATYGPIGVLVRMGDKLSRLQSVTRSGINLINNESVRDTLIDLYNYAAMAIMLMDETQKTVVDDIHEQAIEIEKQLNIFNHPQAQNKNLILNRKVRTSPSLRRFKDILAPDHVTMDKTPSPGPIIKRRTAWS